MRNGRIEVGLGAGWYKAEHDAYGLAFPSDRARYDLLEDQLAVLDGVWSAEPGTLFTYKGRTCSVELQADSLRPAQLNAIQASCRRLWFVFSHTGDPHGPGGARANQARFLALGTALNRRYIDRATATLGYAAPIGVALLVR